MSKVIKLVWRKSEPASEPAKEVKHKQAKAFANLDLSEKGAKKFTEVKDEGGRITDALDMTLKGYLSTFQATTAADRDGDYVEDGAFKDSIARSKTDPIPLLVDHDRSMESQVGVFTSLKEDKKGLLVEAKLTNAPGAQDLRVKIAEGLVGKMSMGGRFHYKEDGRGIFKVDLYEGSIVTIPANPDAEFTVS